MIIIIYITGGDGFIIPITDTSATTRAIRRLFVFMGLPWIDRVHIICIYICVRICVYEYIHTGISHKWVFIYISRLFSRYIYISFCPPTRPPPPFLCRHKTRATRKKIPQSSNIYLIKCSVYILLYIFVRVCVGVYSYFLYICIYI